MIYKCMPYWPKDSLWVPAGGSITSRCILLCHQINGGLWRILYKATFIIIGAQGVLNLGLSLSPKWGAHTMGAPIFTCCLQWHWQLFIQYDSSPQHQPVSSLFGINLGWILHMIWEGSHLMWVSLWHVETCWHWVPSVAILVAGLGVVVVPWHGHHAQLIPAP